MKNKIYIDARCLQDPNYAYRGVGLHTKTLLRHAKTFFNGATELHGLLEASLPELSEEHRALFHSIQYSRGGLDAFKDTLFIQPSPFTHNQGNYAQFICKESVFKCAIVYDFIPFIKGGYYFPNIASRLQYLANLEWLKQYDLLFPISEYTATSAHSIANIPFDKQRVTGVAVRDSFRPVKSTSETKLHSGFNPYNYFIVVGGGDPRKNVEIVIKAHIHLLEQLKDGPGLIIVGKYSPSHYDSFRQFYLKKGLEKLIEFQFDISDTQLSHLYSYALANISPSLIEGFSIPVIEAMACKCPVIASRIDAHQELIADHFLLFNPNSEQELFTLMQKITADPAIRASIVDSQFSTASRFSPDKVAQRFWEPILKKQQLLEKKPIPRPLKPRIAFVTPYPPDESGVADYSAVCLQEFSKYVDIDVFTDASHPIASSHIRNFYPITSMPYASNKYARVISVVGCSPFHTKIIKNLKEFGGSCIAHDHTLAYLYFYKAGVEQFSQMASQFLHRPVSHQEAMEWIRDPKKLEYTYFDEIIYAEPLIVHSKIVQSNVKRLHGIAPLYLPFATHNKFADDELSPSSKYHARASLGIPQEQICLMTFGRVNSFKGMLECVYVVDFLQQWGIDIHFYFVGPCHRSLVAEIEQLSTSLNLTKKVHIINHVSAEAYKQFLVAADYAIQLRKLLMGALSGALVDCISAGLPTIANESLAESMEAPKSVIRVNDHLSPFCLAETIYYNIKNNCHLEKNLSSKNEYFVKHNFSYYCNQLLQLLQLNQQ